MHFRILALAVLLLSSALPGVAQQSVKLQFNGGQVTLSAQNAPIRVILAEWARLGGATIVNGDRVAGPPVTLELAGVPERQALDIVLRSVAGYMLAPRREGTTGASSFDRILILPTSAGPRNPTPAPGVAGARPALPRPPIVARQPEPSIEEPNDPDQDADPLEDPAALNQPPNQPRPGDPRFVQPPFVMRPPVTAGVEIPDPDDADDADNQDSASPPSVAPTPTNPFGIPSGSSARPGVVTPAPRPQQQRPNRVQ
jgi:hypothetical protein